MDKPQECVGCPCYGNGRDFVPDLIPDNVEYVVAMDVPPQNFKGRDAGDTVEAGFHKREMIPYTGVEPQRVGYMHLLRCKAAIGVKDAKAKEAKLRCRAHDQLEGDSVVVAVGQAAWNTLAGTVDGGRPEWFGFMVEASVPAKINQKRNTEGLNEFLFGGKK